MPRMSIYVSDRRDSDILRYMDNVPEGDRSWFMKELLRDGIRYRMGIEATNTNQTIVRSTTVQLPNIPPNPLYITPPIPQDMPTESPVGEPTYTPTVPKEEPVTVPKEEPTMEAPQQKLTSQEELPKPQKKRGRPRKQPQVSEDASDVKTINEVPAVTDNIEDDEDAFINALLESGEYGSINREDELNKQFDAL